MKRKVAASAKKRLPGWNQVQEDSDLFYGLNLPEDDSRWRSTARFNPFVYILTGMPDLHAVLLAR
jgi:hypothetical protein